MRAEDKILELQTMQDMVIDKYVADSIKRGAENYAPLYKKYPKLFKQLVKSEIMTDRQIRKYFRELSSRAENDTNWNEYALRTANATDGVTFKGANILDYLVKAFWENEVLVLKVMLTGTLMDAMESGGLFTIEDLKVDVPWSRNEPPVIEFMNKYTLQLAKGLTRHTQDRVYSAIKESISNGEDRDGAIKRINQVINDPRRATMIAQTESVRAFSEGRIQVATEIGADRKRWRTAGATDYCADFAAEDVVGMSHTWKTPRGEAILQPPAHPNCRCGIEIFMPNEKL